MPTARRIEPTKRRAKPLRRLAEYLRKRDFAATPEPASAGRARASKAAHFVVQLHHASHRHFDFRLQIGDTLHSWAIPKCPSLDPAVKRLAVEVEDHPLDYGDFEGEIPAGHYGAGTVAIWDRGRWQPEEGDAASAVRAGHLKFRLDVERLRGSWALVRTRSRGGRAQWLLIKHRDAFAREGDVADDRPLGDGAAAPKPAPSQSRSRSGAPLPGPDDLQLARHVDAAPRGAHWQHEVKYDGYRLLLCRDGRRVRLLSRNGLDWTARLPHIAEALRALPARRLALDGELVAPALQGPAAFAALQAAMAPGGDTGALLVRAFDLLHLEGEDPRPRPLAERRALLETLLAAAPDARIAPSERVSGDGKAAWARACRTGMEGLISKDLRAPYHAGRGDSWRKLKCVNGDDYAVIGYTAGKGARAALCALLLARPEGDRWRYFGRVGSGFSTSVLKSLRESLRPRAKAPELINPPSRADLQGATPVWVAPRQVVEVAYRGLTGEGLLRQASLRGLRPDKRVAELRESDREPAPAPAKASKAVASAAVTLSHPERLVFRKPAIRKQQLADFYTGIADWLLPGIRQRPISLLRCPDGAAGTCFFQRHLSSGFHDAVHEVLLPDGRSGRQVIHIDDAEGLRALVQMGVIEIHAWGSTIDDLQRASRLVFDLDPGAGVEWRRVIAAARCLRERLGAVGLESFVRTSGGKGLHVVVPLAPAADWDSAKAFAQALARVLAAEQPDDFVAVAGERNRKGRIFIDYLRNSLTASAIASYSLRARPGAGVATPLAWEELGRLHSPAQYHFGNLSRRLARLRDPWADIEKLRQSLPDARSLGASP